MSETQATKVAIQNFALAANQPTVLGFIAKDEAGVAIDISTGFAAALHFQSKSLPDTNPVTLAGTWSYDADGNASLALTAAQSKLLPCGEQLPYQVLLTATSATNASVICKGNITSTQQIV